MTESKNMIKKDSVKIVGRAKVNKPKATIDPTHSQLCKAITDYMQSKYPDKLFIHIPNEGNITMMGKLKAEGLLPGVYDYFLAHVKMTYDSGALVSLIPGLWIEVKTKKDRLSKQQKSFKERAMKAHYSTLEVNNIDDFIDAIGAYLS